MNPFPLCLTACAVLLGQSPDAKAPQASRPGAVYHAPSESSPAGRLIKEIQEHQEATQNLERLCDDVGPRLTGSERLLKAHDLLEAKLRAYGLAQVHREGYEFGPAWSRGVETGRLLTHGGARLDLAQVAWSHPTRGPLRAGVVFLDPAHLEGMEGRLRGRIVVVGEADRAHREGMKQLSELLEKGGPAAVLYASEKKDGLLTMTGSPHPTPWWRMGKEPAAFLSRESHGLLRRLCARKEPVEMELNLGGRLGTQPVQAFNTVAEIPGAERPDEVVLLGAHLDSWDLGTGAMDNGTGVAAAVEALRAVQASGLRPRRTLRLVLFSGEEQGLLGSKAYVKAHANELERIQAVLIHDLGTGRVRGWALQELEAARPAMARAIAPLQELGVRELPLEGSRDSDHAPFLKKGVPAFFAIQEPGDYFRALHHSQIDTYDHVRPEELVQGAQALAVTAWELAAMEERLPRPEAEAPKG